MMQDKQLLDEFHALPSDKQAEVIDFIQRLKAKQTNTVIQNDASENHDHSIPGEKSQEETKTEKPLRRFGGMKGLVIYMADDFDAPMEDFAEYM